MARTLAVQPTSPLRLGRLVANFTADFTESGQR
jgi:hypothetical protein